MGIERGDLQDSLDELTRIADELVDGLSPADDATEETEAGAAPEEDGDDAILCAEGLKETLEEIDQLDGVVLSIGSEVDAIDVGSDGSTDIDDALDAVLSGAGTSVPAVEVDEVDDEIDAVLPEEVEAEPAPPPVPVIAAVPEPLPWSAATEPPPQTNSRSWLVLAAVLIAAATVAAWLLVPRLTSTQATVEPPVPRAAQPKPEPPAIVEAPPIELPVEEPTVAPAPPPVLQPAAARAVEPAVAKPEAPPPHTPTVTTRQVAVPAKPLLQAPQFDAPEAESRVEPVYTPAALARGDRGTVVLSVLVDESGRVARAIVDRGIPGSDLDQVAIDAVLRWTFRPASEEGRPMRAWVTVSFNFEP